MTQSEIKFVRSLAHQKYRKEHKAYLIQGNKIVKEWLESGSDFIFLIGTDEWIRKNEQIIPSELASKIRPVAQHVLDKMTVLTSSTEVMGVVNMLPERKHDFQSKDWTIVLDRVQDPGNLGTIIRTADWFGFSEILMTPGTVEIYNPKVVQSTMGSLLRVSFAHLSLEELFEQAQKNIWLTAMEGVSVYSEEFLSDSGAYIILGNEAQGIDPNFLAKAERKLSIPRLGGAESLNVAIAGAVICAQIRSRKR